MKFGLGQYRAEDDSIVEVNVVDPEVAAEAQEAQELGAELSMLCDVTEEYIEAGSDISTLVDEHNVQVQVMDGDLSQVGNEITVKAEDDVVVNIDAKELGESVGTEDGEVLNPESTDAEVEEVSAKLENDLNSIIGRIGGTLRSSKFNQGLLGRYESDFKLKGKAGYRARVESISEVGKKVWENIKAFFAKIWEFIKSLFERFTALFKSNKSVLEGLKKKLEGEEDSRYHSLKSGAKVGHALAYFTEVKGSEILKAATSVTSGIMDKIKAQTKDGKPLQAGGSAALKVTIGGASKGAGDFEASKNKQGTYEIAGVTGEGLVGWSYTDKKRFVTANLVLKNPKEFDKSKSKRDMLIDICETGIELCNELTSKFIKDSEKDFNEMKSNAQEVIDNIYDKDDANKNNDSRKTTQREKQTFITSGATAFSKMIAVIGQQPSMAVRAVREGMSICQAEEK